MSWNYRVIKYPQDKKLVEKHKCDTHYYKIMETYYDENNVPHSFGQASPINEDMKTLKADMKLQMKAFNVPIIIVDKDYNVLGYE